MEAGPTLRFALAARRISAAARDAGLVAPAFRSPPGRPDVVRTLRRHRGGAVVAVRTRARPFDRVAADMVEGVIAVNDLEGGAAHRVRVTLWEVALATDGEPEAAENRVAAPTTSPGEDPARAGGADFAEARVAERQTQAA